MTVYDYMKQRLEEHGLFSKDAESVLLTAMDKDHYGGLSWSSPISGYPHAVLSVTWLWLCEDALEWIDENAPQHFARAMFVPMADVSRS